MKSCNWTVRYALVLGVGKFAAALPAAAATASAVGDLAAASVLNGVGGDVSDLAVAATAFASVIKAATATATPTDIDQASSMLSGIFAPYATNGAVPNWFDSALSLVTTGLSIPDLSGNVIGDTVPLSGANSFNNSNTREPGGYGYRPIYPRADYRDASYDQTEQALRGAIYIPDTFKYCSDASLVPLILAPGTGTFGGANFGSNMIKLLQGGGVADVVWLNIPNALLDDVQYNAEFVAYAINYISAFCNGEKIAVATWSQGSLDTAWALQYWPSTRGKVADVINYSPDYHGTVLAYLLNPKFPPIPAPPSVIQQEWNSTFINTLRSAGGDSAYVPTTTIYSALLDEIVEPQQGTAASAFLHDDRGVGVTNNEVQSVCLGQPGGTFYTHEGVLYNPLAYALTIDALTHDGPGRPSRLDLAEVCSTYATPGLSLPDLLATEANIPIAGYNIFTYANKRQDEPPIRSYAK